MAEYTVLWLIISLFITGGVLTSILFFRRKMNDPRRKHVDLDSVLFHK